MIEKNKVVIKGFSLLISSLILCQTCATSALALGSSPIQRNVEYNESMQENVEDSTFTLANSNVQISDNYGDESAYISETQIFNEYNFEEMMPYNLEQIIDQEQIYSNSINQSTQGDPMVYLTQKWLNQEYGNVEGFGSVPENGKTGWDTIYGLLRALQHELGITSLANSFGPSTSSLYQQNLLYRQDGVTDRKFAILQGALWCKGYSPGYYLTENSDGTVVFNEIFNSSVEQAVIQLKTDAGFINPNGVVTLNVMKALMSMDSFKLLSSYGGTTQVRSMQQKLNRKYEAYTGLTPCDGVYGRNTNKALVYALQAEELMPTSVANGNFGTTTKLCCPNIPYVKNSGAARTYPGTSSGSYYTASQISEITELLQFSLLVNGFGDGIIDGVFDSVTQQDIRNFQKEMAITITGKADLTTWLSLFISSGDTSRSALASDCATILTPAKAQSLYNNGYRYVGRYLTGTYNGGISKAITREEAQIIFDAGLKFFPIYQTSANYLSYFTIEQGAIDAKKATKAADALGLPKNTIIYFAVDFDCLDYQITNNIIPYFKQIHDEMAGSGYKVGIYGTRNACTRVSNLGYACSSFVGDMSTGFSGNLGFGMPDNWAFDQFKTITIGSGSGQIEIDKDGYSGRDPAVSKINPIIPSINSNNIIIGSTETDTVTGPMVNILGYQVPLFELDVGIDANGLAELDTEYDSVKNEYKVLIGYNVGSTSTESTGGNTRIGKFNQAYTEVKTTFSSIGKNDQEFSQKFCDIKGSLYQKGVKVGFDCDAYMFGYMTINCNTGKIAESGVVLVGTVKKSISYPLVPCIYAKFTIEGSLKTGFELVKNQTGQIGLEGNMAFAITPKISVGVDVLVASAYAGISGTLSCGLDFPISSFAESFSAELSASVFFEYQALFWGNSYNWEFASTQLYPQTNTANYLSISNDDLNFIEPFPQQYTRSLINNSNIMSSNVQVYCNPEIASLGSGKMIMTYIADSTDRTATNRSTLMYRIYDGTAWSAPQPVLNDLTADFEPSIYADGTGGAHIIWQNCNTVLPSNVTLEQMASSMDLYYTHWNGTSFDGTTAITNNNSNYEMAHKVVSSGNNISIIWQQNSLNDVFALSGTNSIYRKQFQNGVWQDIENIASGLSTVTSLDTSYVSNNNVIAYTAKTNTITSEISDMEVFYYNGYDTIRVTNDNVPDYSVSLLNEELYWMSNNSIFSVSNGNIETKTTVITDLNANITKIKALKNSNNKKVVVWQQESNSGVNFYGTNYNQTTNTFSSVEPLLTDSGIIRGWDACVLPNGQIEISYGFAEKLSEPVNGKPYGQIDLMQKTSNEFYDIYIDPISSYSGIIAPGEDINIRTNVYNNGSLDINQFTVNILGNDNTLIQSQTIEHSLSAGNSTELDIPFTLSNSLTKTDYTIQIFPYGQNDVNTFDNESIITLGYADITINSIQENRIESGRSIDVTVKNKGYSTINNASLKFFKEDPERTLLSTNTISQLQPNAETIFTFIINDTELNSTVSENSRMYYFVLETNETESNNGNNSKFIHVYPDYTIGLTTGIGGVVSGAGTYENGEVVTLIATPNTGYIFDGWYENNQLVYSVPEEYTITVDSNRTLEARFKENDLEITNHEVFGTLEVGKTISFTATAQGGIQPWQWEFYIQANGESVYSNNTAIVNFFEWTPTESGNYNVLVYVTDATGKKVSYTTQIIIVA